jgi:phage-related protein
MGVRGRTRCRRIIARYCTLEGSRKALRAYTTCYIIVCVREALKRIVWHGDSLERIRSFPGDARQDAGYELERVQRNLEPRDWKPMNAAGAGVIEIRVHAGGEYRVFYVAKFKDAVHVLHAFVKKTQKTRRAEIELAAKRYREALEE